MFNYCYGSIGLSTNRPAEQTKLHVIIGGNQFDDSCWLSQLDKEDDEEKKSSIGKSIEFITPMRNN